MGFLRTDLNNNRWNIPTLKRGYRKNFNHWLWSKNDSYELGFDCDIGSQTNGMSVDVGTAGRVSLKFIPTTDRPKYTTFETLFSLLSLIV